jgi:glutamate decarboxylase
VSSTAGKEGVVGVCLRLTTVTATVYGSKYAGEDLPRHEMPEREMPAAVAHRMIKDDLTLDGTPTLNLASFVTTYMEKEAEDLMV